MGRVETGWIKTQEQSSRSFVRAASGCFCPFADAGRPRYRETTRRQGFSEENVEVHAPTHPGTQHNGAGVARTTAACDGVPRELCAHFRPFAEHKSETPPVFLSAADGRTWRRGRAGAADWCAHQPVASPRVVSTRWHSKREGCNRQGARHAHIRAPRKLPHRFRESHGNAWEGFRGGAGLTDRPWTWRCRRYHLAGNSSGRSRGLVGRGLKVREDGLNHEGTKDAKMKANDIRLAS